MLNINKFIRYLSTFNLINILIGYPVVTSLFLPIGIGYSNNTQLVTIPFRLFSLILCITVILIVFIKRKDLKSTFNYPIVIFLVFWSMYFIRIVYDLSIRNDNVLNNESILNYYTFVIFIVGLPIISVYKSYYFIDLNLARRFIIIFGSISLFILAFYGEFGITESINTRVYGNAALNPISYGIFGSLISLISIDSLVRGVRINTLKRLTLVPVIFLGMIAIGRSGSRLPFMAFVLVLVVYFSSGKKNVLLFITLFTVFSLIIVGYFETIINFIGKLFPVLESRLLQTIIYGDLSDRDYLYNLAITQFLENPILGDYFVLLPQNGKGINSHNIILDVIMSLGFIGGIIIIWIIVIAFTKILRIFQIRSQYTWVAIISMVQLLYSFSSGSLYTNPEISISLITLFMLSGDIRNLIKQKIPNSKNEVSTLSN